jgi:hypothetical protein
VLKSSEVLVRPLAAALLDVLWLVPRAILKDMRSTSPPEPCTTIGTARFAANARGLHWRTSCSSALLLGGVLIFGGGGWGRIRTAAMSPRPNRERQGGHSAAARTRQLTSGDCFDTDNGATDPYGAGCADWYDSNQGGCGDYDSESFASNDMCCTCGGGSASASPTPSPSSSAPPTSRAPTRLCCFDFIMYDSYSDRWQGAFYRIRDTFSSELIAIGHAYGCSSGHG